MDARQGDQGGMSVWGESRLDDVLSEVRDEVQQAVRRHAPLHSPHEGWAVIREELDELWFHVVGNSGRSPEARHEALQVAAMGIRYALDLAEWYDRER